MWVLSKRWWIISIVLMAPGVIFLVLGINNPGARTDDGVSYVKFGLLWICLILLTHGVMFVFLLHQKKRAARFRGQGIEANATILEIDTTGSELNNMPGVEMRLRIEIPGREPYVIRHKRCINPLSIPMLQRGARLPVLVDPHHHKRIMFVEDCTENGDGA